MIRVPRSAMPRLRAFALALVLGATACEPAGPGSLTATVRTPVATGAVILELRGPAVTALEGLGGTRVFAADAAAADSVRRIVVVSPDAGTLRFRMHLSDLGAEPPRALVVEAVDAANRRIGALRGFEVRIAR